MNALLDHVWGASPAHDRVWTQVTSLAPVKATQRLLMVVQAFIDESEGQDGTFVLAGHVATAESWAAFAKEWEALLPTHGVRGKNGRYQFKMSAMAQFPDRMQKTGAFFSVIEKHVLYSLSCRINRHEVRRAQERLWLPDLDIDWGFVNNPYWVGFRSLLDMFHGNKHRVDELVSDAGKVDFIFDDRAEKRAVLAVWDDYIEKRPPETKDLYGATPRFEKDEEFLPLQAGDFWAWWVRKWCQDGDPTGGMLSNRSTWPWPVTREEHPRLHISFNEDQIVEMLMRLVNDMIEPDRFRYDIRYPRDTRYTRGGMTHVRFRGPSPFGR